jgi:hypothetical protein
VRPDRATVSELELDDAVVHRDPPNVLPEGDGAAALLEPSREGARDPVHALDRYTGLGARVVAAQEVLERIAGVVRIESRVVAERVLDEQVGLRAQDRRQGVAQWPLDDRSVQVGGGRSDARPVGRSDVSRAGQDPLEGIPGEVVRRTVALLPGKVVPGARHRVAWAAADPFPEVRPLRSPSSVERPGRDGELGDDRIDPWVAGEIAHAAKLDRLG